MDSDTVTVKTQILNKEMKYNGVTLLTYKITYPVFASSRYQLTLLKINKYYETMAMEYQRYCENDLFKIAVDQYKEDAANTYPVRVFEVIVEFTVTYNSACIVSLYFDKYEFTGGAHGNTIRYSQTWNLQTGSQIQLNELINCAVGYKPYVTNLVKEETAKNPVIYFPDYNKLILETFNENNFYCTPKGIVIYYQQYDIAPYSSGIREFLIPYSDCVENPVKKCFPVR